GAAGWAAAATAAYLDRVPAAFRKSLPGRVLRAQSAHHLLLAAATGVSLTAGATQGLAGADLLALGVLDPLSLTGAVSAAWWATQGYAAWRLRRVLKKWQPKGKTAVAKMKTERVDPLIAAILSTWSTIAADGQPAIGHRLTSIQLWPGSHWEAEITTDGRPVAESLERPISAAYGAPVVTIRPGVHAGHALLRVDLVARPEGPSAQGLAGMWQRVADSLPAFKGSRVVLEEQTPFGPEGIVEAAESEVLPAEVDREALARKLGKDAGTDISYERQNAGSAVIRVFDTHPLRSGQAAADPGMIGGWAALGIHPDGDEARVQLWDKASARHLLVAGVSGSGKSVLLDAIMHAAVRGGMVVIHGDQKGGSSDYAGRIGAWTSDSMQAMRLGYALARHRATWPERHGRPWSVHDGPRVLLVLDEVNLLSSQGANGAPEAWGIAPYLATQLRALGISVVMAGQAANADEMFGTKTRDNLILNGGAVLFRTSELQARVLDHPILRECRPSEIPQYWDAPPAGLRSQRAAFDPSKYESTAGLGYVTRGGAPVLFRGYAPAVDLRSMHPEDRERWLDGHLAGDIAADRPEVQQLAQEWPDWERRQHIAMTAVDLADLDTPTGQTPTSGTTVSPVSVPPAPLREPTALERIVAALEDADPVDGMHRDDIAAIAAVSGNTLKNELAAAVKAGRVVRVSPGRYALPETSTDDIADADSE
ncbi:ATP-binding protein, partial [Streptomyces sp. UH6]|uniref:ATP-binding protein n=1 Tax=Streptomyces sp. UH6 TaxID=2748379 RepID=UPI0015D4E683